MLYAVWNSVSDDGKWDMVWEAIVSFFRFAFGCLAGALSDILAVFVVTNIAASANAFCGVWITT